MEVFNYMSVISYSDAKKNIGFMTSSKSANSEKKTVSKLLSEAFKVLNSRK